MFKQLIFLTLLTAVVIHADLEGWRNCGSPFAELRSIRITNCTQAPCTFVRGHAYLVEVDAISRANSHTLPFASTAPFLGVNITLLTGNACDHLSVGHCPASHGLPFTFRMLYEVPTNIPPVSTTVTTLLWINTGDIALCIEIQSRFI